jgi:hypothetical protein
MVSYMKKMYGKGQKVYMPREIILDMILPPLQKMYVVCRRIVV